jgi:sugar lactone lactonase YvrE
MQRRFLLFALAGLALLPGCPESNMPGDGGPEPFDGGIDAAGPRVEVFVELGAATEGIALGTDPSDQPVLYVGTLDDRIVRIRPDATVEPFVTINDPLGIAVRADGSLLVCAKDATDVPGIFVVTREGTISTLVATGPSGPFGLTNFVAVAPDDSIVFSDSMSDVVYRANADGSNVTVVSTAVSYPNGITFSGDGNRLYVSSWSTNTIHPFLFDRATSSYMPDSLKGILAAVSNIDGLVTTGSGRYVFVTSSRGITVGGIGAADRVLLATVLQISLPANGAFGGPAFGVSNLYVTALGETELFVVRTEDTGVPLPVR